MRINMCSSDEAQSPTDSVPSCMINVMDLNEMTSNTQKKSRISTNTDSLFCKLLIEIEDPLPTLCTPDYYMEPSSSQLAAQENLCPGYCSNVPDFTVGRIGYGYVKFLGMTDVRHLDLDQIVKFRWNELVVYEDESAKPLIGQGLNKPAEVTLIVHLNGQTDDIANKLRLSTERQGADFVSFDPANGEWKFLVKHFSRFGLSEDDEDDIVMDDAMGAQDSVEMNGSEIFDIDEEPQVDPTGPELSHSLPVHLGLDPAQMKEMRMLMFSAEEEEESDDSKGISFRQKSLFCKERIRSPSQSFNQKVNHRTSPHAARKTPLALLEYNPSNFDSNSSRNILMAQENRNVPLKMTKTEGFKLDLKHVTPVTGNHSRNIVDAGLFMGRSFRVGWGPNGILVHSGAAIGSNGSKRLLSSVINIEKVAIDKVVRDENNKVKKELVDISFDAPLNLHKALNHETEEIEFGSFQLVLRKVVSNRVMLSEICRNYIDIIERQLEVSGLTTSARLVLMHQVMVWELIKVLFSERENTLLSKSVGADNEEDMMQDMKEESLEVDPEALPLIRRAEFSCWLQESVCHRVQEDISSLTDSSYLEHLLLLLTGRQLDEAVEQATSRGDVRLACLLSQAGGSTENRSYIERQLELWRMNGLDFSFIEKDRIRVYELLAGNVHDALQGLKIDWKRFLGLVMWYLLPPDTSLPIVFQTYQHLLDNGKAPFPVPNYIDEGPIEDVVNLSREENFDFSYYLMLLHASEEKEFSFLKTMLSAFSSTHDPLDYHMIWHQCSVLEAVGVIRSDDLQVLDMGFVSQLLSQGQCHWAIYVALNMTYRDDYPHLQANLIRDILFQYCENWNSDESQRQFIENLGVPLEWMHEALATYFNYNGDLPKALEHFIGCANWQKAHSIFTTSVAHTLFLSANHSEIWRIATSMEDHKSEIENWDLGAGIYISFYVIRNSLQEDNNTTGKLDSLESKNTACRDFFGQLNESLAAWDKKLTADARVAYAKMAEEVSELLLSDMSENGRPTYDSQLSCFDTVFNAPLPEDLRANHLQDAVSLYTCYLSEMTS